MRPKIGEFKFGKVYGESEVQYLDDYSKYFYDINGSLGQLENNNKIMVIGRKGTGKTLLVNVFCERKRKNNFIAVVESLKDFVFHELIHFQGQDISSTKYVPIFKWMVLVNIAKNIVKDDKGFNVEKIEHLKGFLRSFGHFAGELRPEQTIEITREFQHSGEAGLGFKLPILNGGIKAKGGEVEKTKEIKRNYLECIESLQSFLVGLINESSRQICIFYDELDDKFDSTLEYKNAVISFMSAIMSINSIFLKGNVKAKVGAVIRYDIINSFSSPNINRIIEDNSVTIDWNNNFERASDSEIYDMLTHKIKNSTPYYNRLESSELFGRIFSERVAGEHGAKYILHRTLGRPRDAIRMLTYIQEEFGVNAERFEASMFTITARKYSSYLLREIRSELAGHLQDSDIDDCFALLRTVKKRCFSPDFIKEKYEKLNLSSDALTLNKILEHLFKVGAIGNVLRRSKAEGGDAYLWSYTNEDLEADMSMNFEIHCGLWDALGVIKPKIR
ncbi:P-loop ATPase, Sll1717 family [Citrobacter freundii]|uniref:P-loop ATPase, Sll1717 family n=1 Tax=Citrobacter freundii TaxID=546 RepID=UPI0018AB2C9F|nr:hypothetical protein [Citrobacter freundii]